MDMQAQVPAKRARKRHAKHVQTQFKFLGDCAEYIPNFAKLLQHEMQPLWEKDPAFCGAIQRLEDYTYRDQLPLGIVATYDNQPAGLACLRHTHPLVPDSKPWLRNLIVDPAYRNLKIGMELVQQIKTLARLYQYTTLHTLVFHQDARNWLLQHGWQDLGETSAFGYHATVLCSVLD